MTQEEKARAYDEALKVAEKYHNGTLKDVMETIFPELKESEDERIRKGIIRNLEYLMDRAEGFVKDELKERIAWLEKQGEHKPDDKVEPKFKIGDIIRLKDGDGLEWTVEGVLNNGYYTIVCADRDDFIQLDDKWELVEQKPAWSEEDERLRTSCIKHIEEELERIRNDKYGHSEIISVLKESCRERINWLKSIKDKYTWKPSDEQIKAVKEAACYSSVFSEKTIDNLISLSKQLKKLREEQL